MAKEIYLTDSSLNGAKYLLMITEQGTVTLTWYHGTARFKEDNPIIAKRGNVSIVEFGKPNIFGIRQSIPFIGEDGKILDRWEKIL